MFWRFGFLVGFAFTATLTWGENEAEYKRLMHSGDDLLHDAEQKRWAGEKERQGGNFQAARDLYNKALGLQEAALKDFQSAESCAPSTGPKHAVFFEGVAWAEKGQTILAYNLASPDPKRGGPGAFCAAVHEIERAIDLGMTEADNPALYFFFGLALFDSGDNHRGYQFLDRFLQSDKGNSAQRAQTEELMDLAQKAMTKAGQITPAPMCGKPLVPHKEPTKNDKDAAPPPPSESQWVGSLGTGVGYDGNVTKLGRGLPEPAGLNGKGAVFTQTTLYLEGDLFWHHQYIKGDKPQYLIDKLSASYLVTYENYDEHSSANNLGQTGVLKYCHVLDPKLCLGLQLGDTWLRDDSRNISNNLAPQISLNQVQSEKFAGQISYTIAWAKYFTPSTALTNLDGFTHRLGLLETYTAFQHDDRWLSTLSFTGQYGHEWTVTDGIVGDRQRDGALIRADCAVYNAPDCCTFVRSVSFGSSYEYRHDEYSNATFPMLTAAQRYKRIDNFHMADCTLSVKMWYDERIRNRLELTLNYKWTTDNSNVPAKTFDQPRFLAAVKVNF